MKLVMFRLLYILMSVLICHIVPVGMCDDSID